MIVIAKSPLRVSFFGGGTDYPAYFERYDGCVLGSAIDKFIYTAALPMAGVAETRFRLTYRTVETVNRVSEIKHNVVRC
jgi:D-glycero-alpha-D-manno-heptose-7-phosphate kinase